MWSRLTSLLVLLALLSTVGGAEAGAPADIYYNPLDFSDMHTFDLSGMNCLLQAELPGNPGGKCTDPQGHSSIFTDIYKANGDFIGNPGAGNPSQYIVQNSNCRGGAGSCYQASVRTSDVNGGDYSIFAIAKGGNTSVTTPPTNIYSRGFWKFPVGYTLPDICVGGKFMYFRDNINQGTFQNTSFVGPINPQNLAAQGGFKIELQTADNGQPATNYQSCLPGRNCILPIDGQYHSLEVHVNVPGHLFEMWIDDVQHMSVTVNTFNPIDNYNEFSWGHFNAQQDPQQPGFGHCAPSQNENFWVDDVALSTQRIGGAGTTTTPNPPTSFQLSQLIRRIWAWLLPAWTVA